MYKERIDRLLSLMPGAGLDALALNPGPSLVYLTGLPFHLMERPTVAIFAPGQAPALVLAELEMRKVEQAPISLQPFPFGDNPATWGDAFQHAIHAMGLAGKTVGVEPGRMRVLELRFLEAAAPGAKFVSAQDTLAGLRMQKDASELALMRQAVNVAQRALEATLPRIKIGVTERELASELTFQLLRHGADPSHLFSPIVSSGPNSANPHAVPSDRRLAAGDLLVIDWGATVGGYFSDLTRTYGIGRVEEEFARIASLVLEANTAGQAAIRPGVPAGEIDRAARVVIDRGGYAAYFTHRVGHGLGMEEHEDPYMFAENPMLLAPGMTFTVEPGIYLPGRGGLRIEDDVAVTSGGGECLSDLPRDLTLLG
jgi:Xaa-Pro dipeptidase